MSYIPPKGFACYIRQSFIFDIGKNMRAIILVPMNESQDNLKLTSIKTKHELGQIVGVFHRMRCTHFSRPECVNIKSRRYSPSFHNDKLERFR